MAAVCMFVVMGFVFFIFYKLVKSIIKFFFDRGR